MNTYAKVQSLIVQSVMDTYGVDVAYITAQQLQVIAGSANLLELYGPETLRKHSWSAICFTPRRRKNLNPIRKIFKFHPSLPVRIYKCKEQ